MKRGLRIFIFMSVIGLTTCLAHGENMFFNSSFELGEKGYTTVRRSEYKPGSEINYKRAGVSQDDSTAFHGDNSLKLSIDPSDGVSVSSHEVVLKAKMRYSFSFYAKTNGEKVALQAVFLSTMGGWRIAGNWKDFTIDGEWKRYETTFTTKDKFQYDYEKDHYLFLKFPFGQKSLATVWLDGLQLEEGGVTAYAPARNIEAAVYAPSQLLDNAGMKGAFRVISYNQSLTSHDLTLSLDDEFFKKRLERKDFKIDLPAGKSVSRDFCFDAKRLGAMSVTTNVDNDKCAYCSAAYFVRTLSPLKSYGKGFQVGVMAGCLESIVTKRRDDSSEPFDLVWYDGFGAPGQLARFARLSGSTFANSYGSSTPFFTPTFEPERDKFQWTLADIFVKEAEKNNLAAIAALPSQGFLRIENGYPQTPDWLRQLDRGGKPDGSDLGGWRPTSIMPPADVLEAQCAAIASRYGDKIKAYEPFSEANGYIPAKCAVEYVAAVYNGIKKNAPAAEVIGIIGTEDAGSNASGYFAECIEAGEAKYCDAYQFHPYIARMDDSPVSAMKLIRSLREVTRKNNATKPLWDGEVFYLLPTQQAHGTLEMTFAGDAVARRLLIDMGEGVDRSSPLTLRHLFQSPSRPRQSSFYLSDERNPSDRFAAFSAVARFTTGAEPVRTLELPGKVLCYVFRNDAKLFNVIWAIRDKGVMKLALPDNTKVTVYDLFGNEVKSGQGELALTLDRNPLYLEWKGAAVEEIVSSFERAKYERENPFVVTDPKMTRNSEGKLCVGLTLRNETAEKLSGTVRVNNLEWLMDGGGDVNYGEINGVDQKTALIPIQLNPNAPNKFTVKVLVSAKNKIFSYEKTLSNVNQLEVNAGSWTAPIPIIGEKDISARDFGASFALSRDGDDLLVKLSVVDDKRSASTKPNRPYESDCVELFLDLEPLKGDLEYMARHNEQCFQLIVPTHAASEAKAMRIVYGKLTDAAPLTVKADVNDVLGGYETTIRVSLKSVMGDIVGKSLGFTLAVNDNDDGKYKYNLTWTGTKNYCDRSGYATLYFMK